MEVYQIYNFDSHSKIYRGFGDYIRGCIYLYQLSKKQNFNLNINFTHHPLSKVFKCNTNLSYEECLNCKYYNDYDDIKPVKYLFCGKPPRQIPDNECKKFIIDNCLTPLPDFTTKLDSVMKSLDLKDYITIHVRTFDKGEIKVDVLNKIKSQIQNILKKNSKKQILLVGSNQEYLDLINHPVIIKTNLTRCHTALDDSIEKNQDTMIEFMLLVKSKKIYQISVFSWGSNFTEVVNKIYSVPLQRIKI
jgi:dihydrofolate reductase